MAPNAFDLTGAVPFDRDAADNAPVVLGASSGPFLYIGTGLTAPAFATYVASYNFGRIPPSYIVLHHTAIPSTLVNRFPSGAVWDADERGLSDAQIYQKRTRQLDNLRNFYRDTLGWDRGPHLFIDDKYIWLFTPMNAVGIHAKEGNSYTIGGKLHYSIGIEVVGYYEEKPWPAPVAANVRAALHAISARLGIALTYTPGPLHTPSAHAGSLSSHRDYNKPGCPGKAITEAFYVAAVAPPAPVAYVPYVLLSPCTPFTDRSPSAPLAGVVLQAGAVVNMGDKRDGWLWISDRADTPPGIGFIPESYGRPL